MPSEGTLILVILYAIVHLIKSSSFKFTDLMPKICKVAVFIENMTNISIVPP